MINVKDGLSFVSLIMHLVFHCISVSIMIIIIKYSIVFILHGESGPSAADNESEKTVQAKKLLTLGKRKLSIS